MKKIFPVILSGGSGTRLWPLSRTLFPKQLLPLASERSLLQDTARRVADLRRFHPPLVICNEEHRFIIAEQLAALDIVPRDIVLEPVGRNTAPAAAVAALLVMAEDPEATLLLLPADHVIEQEQSFLAAVEMAAATAERGALVMLGNRPTSPETGFGYIHRGEAFEGIANCYRVDHFVEKPDAETAKRLCDDGGYYWNAGIFLFRAARYLEELERTQPQIVAACRAAREQGERDLGLLRLSSESFQAIDGISIDYAVMEHTENAAVVPVTMGWSDIGSWSGLWQIGDKDEYGNILHGEVIAEDVRNSYLRSDGPLLAAKGLDDAVVVALDDAVLVTDRGAAQDVKVLIDRLDKAGRSEVAALPTVYRPWGAYRTIDAGEGFQVKRITVKPGGKLSLQKHRHRAEHWVVVRGMAEVTVGEETFTLTEHQSTTIPLGAVHRLANPGDIPLELIEVQSGSYLGEDDIVRLDDIYGRRD